MPLVPGLNPMIRQGQEGTFAPDAEPEAVKMKLPRGLMIEIGANDGDIPQYDSDGNVIRIDHEDGSVTVGFGGKPLVSKEQQNPGWFDNLVDDIDPMERYRIADDLLRGIQEDIQSREEWVEERAQGIRLLGLKIEIPGLQGSTDGAPIEGMSKVRHPLLQEAVLRFQANARSELLPTDGPVKVRVDDNNATQQEDQLADALEMDLNHYLTTTASEYYPDTDRMLFMLGFGGTAFKKVYFCPLRNRPVSETVDAEDLIVNNAATDLRNARRVTHRVYMRPSVVKRLQILGVYRDIVLDTPKQATLDAAKEERNSQQGINQNNSIRPEDRDREIYECYCELDIKDFEHKHKGSPSGLEIPYRVTIDVTSREILSIARNYDKPEDKNDLPEAKSTFVKYTFVPGMGFYDIGLLHILGNTTNALTAVWRELLDAGMYACFPGFLMSKGGARQNTNIFRIPPGGGQLVETNGMPINQAVMPLPYKEPSQALMALAEQMADTGMRVGGTSELQVGEGRADAPVGTTLAMVDQATKVMNSVHKRMHASQCEEFRLLCEVFKENPKAFWQQNKKPAYKWDEKTFTEALENYDLIPQADPNTASHAQRMMKIMALKQLQQMNPSLYDPIAIDSAALIAIGWSNPQQFMAPISSHATPPPEVLQAQAELKIKQQDADAKTMLAKAKAAELQAKAQQPPEGQNQPPQGLGVLDMAKAKAMHTDSQTKAHKVMSDAQIAAQQLHIEKMKAQTGLMDAHTKARDVFQKRDDIMMRNENDEKDREARNKLELLSLAKEMVLHKEDADAIKPDMNAAKKDAGQS